jgi:acetate kinase
MKSYAVDLHGRTSILLAPDGRPASVERNPKMKVLVLNCGSSSVKFQLLETETETALLRGVVEKIGSSSSVLSFRAVGKRDFREVREVVDHEEAVGQVLSILAHPDQGVVSSLSEIGAVGHRVVHGGQSFSESVVVTEQVLRVSLKIAVPIALFLGLDILGYHQEISGDFPCSRTVYLTQRFGWQN